MGIGNTPDPMIIVVMKSGYEKSQRFDRVIFSFCRDEASPIKTANPVQMDRSNEN